ncbi:MAG: sugar ABC transporter permease [bacterium]|nr:sugar ABC transporter permease [bacterium]
MQLPVMYLRKKWISFLFLLPALLFFSWFSWYPIIRGFIISFQHFAVRTDIPPQFVGWANFRLVFNDPLFWTAWKNVIYFVFLGLLLGYFIPVFLAIAINELRRFRGYFRTAFYLPAILPMVVVAIMWRWFYEPEIGLANYLLSYIHLPPCQWLLSEKTAMVSLVIMATWQGAGATAIIYLAGLQGIPEELYESAEIDGASIRQRLFHITIPQLRPVMLMMLLLQIIGTFQVFGEPLIMTKGGPNNATLTIMLLIYRYAFTYVQFGAAAAISLCLFTVLLILTIIYFRLTKRFQIE